MEDIRLEQGLHEECGVFGIYDPEGSCAQTTYYGLYALQHRGQEACGIAAINDREQSFYKDVGLVSEVFDRETLQRLNGTMAVGHVRYATTGAGARENAQPLTIKYVKGTLAVVHNGNLVDVDRLRARFEYQGQSSTPPATRSSLPTPLPRPGSTGPAWRTRCAGLWGSCEGRSP